MKLVILVLLSLALYAHANEEGRELRGCGCHRAKCHHHWLDVYDYEIDECDERPECPPDSCCVANTTYTPSSSTNFTTIGSGNCTCSCSCVCFSCSCSCNCSLPNQTVTPPGNNTNNTNSTNCTYQSGGWNLETGGLDISAEQEDFEDLGGLV
ncbi:unnamed protein product [Blepharisma stoltei]|uniref:Uncharacterized protein n=1 Tax=Blepharisma stoltei TaxID=1481888 RepID=A0AAU9KE97_9CILI|nr:unnamed protein product [Blepharisma stoltei]